MSIDRMCHLDPPLFYLSFQCGPSIQTMYIFIMKKVFVIYLPYTMSLYYNVNCTRHQFLMFNQVAHLFSFLCLVCCFTCLSTVSCAQCAIISGFCPLIPLRFSLTFSYQYNFHVISKNTGSIPLLVDY
jgi:hypothetical protein